MAKFYEDWFGGQLRAMGEPILARPGVRQGFVRRFRMLVLPSFSPAYAIRVDQARDGRGAVRIVRLNGSGGHQPGKIAQEERFALSVEAMAALNRDIDASLDPYPPISAASNCTDDVRFVIELADQGRSRFVSVAGCSLRGRLAGFVRRIDELRRTVGSDLADYLR